MPEGRPLQCVRGGFTQRRGPQARLKDRVQDQLFHVLQILLEHPGELVTREELQRQIWPADTFVDFEKGLNNAIKRLRGALGNSAEQPLYGVIQTLLKIYESVGLPGLALPVFAGG